MKALADYFDDIQHARYRSAWLRLSADTRYYWASYRAFVDGEFRVNHVRKVTNDQHQLGIWLAPLPDTPHDWDDADLSRAWVISVTHGTHTANSMSVWVVAPEPDGVWRLWEVR